MINQSCLQELANRSNPAAQPNVFTAGRRGGTLQGGADSVGDEVKGRLAGHRNRLPRVMGEDEDLRVIGWCVAPPSFPVVVRPGSAHRPEHVAPQYPRADVLEPTPREIVVDAGHTAFPSVHLTKRAGGKCPLVQRHAANAERIVAALAGAGAVSVDGNAEAVDAKVGHGFTLAADARLTEPFLGGRPQPSTAVVQHSKLAPAWSGWGQKYALPHCNSNVRFTSMSRHADRRCSICVFGG